MQMTPAYQAALNGTLCSTGGDDLTDVGMVNDLGIPLRVSWLDWQGNRCGANGGSWQAGAPGALLESGDVWTDDSTDTGAYWMLTSAYSGAFAGVVQFDASNLTLGLSRYLLLGPGDIGTFPVPNQQIVVPNNSPRVLVGTSKLPVGNWLAREQYWQRMPQSYTLAPQETRTVSYTVTSGMTSTSSRQDTVEASVGVSAGVGWGPVSAHVSSNLSASSSTFQSVTMSEQTTSFNSNVFENPTDEPVMLLVWQLTDELTVFNDAGQPLSSVGIGTQPAVVAGPYNPDDLVARPEPAAVDHGAEPGVPTVRGRDR